MNDFEKQTLERIRELVMEGKLSDPFMIEGLKLLADYSNLKNVKDYATEYKIRPQSVYRFRKPFRLAGYYVITDPN